MFDKIIQFSIKNKLIIGFMTLGLILWGIYSVTRLPIDAEPDITNNQVQIITQAPTLGALEVEQYITAPIELAMANIPKVIDKRSISRSGISVITIVFKDNADIYWARQQISERLKEAEARIPAGLGEPSLGPITTGLGEIYQYTIHTKPGYEKKYSLTDLRTIQDWIVRRQLAGVEGVAEISGWGGYVKQYEVVLDNDNLNAMNITIPEVYAALENNNANTGGSYIEQRSNAYFIRGLGQVKNLDDIGKIVVKNVNGIPVLIRDVATVQFGHATRYGAVTRNGQGEVVGGVVLMLKGENFSQVIKNVKERMKQIQKSLPEGVVIEPYIDRTELVGRAIHTVEKNLLEGGLIVIFVLVLLLGNLRGGLIVASVIPLSMLFAISLMNLFGVSGNLMSLGAIDFGLIVDGAVIIVESVVHRIAMSRHHHQGTKKLSPMQMDNEVHESAKRMMSSASFGQIIILIVYLPIFSLTGIEGKMFRPMAQTVAFAILGALILSLTYVPVMSSLFLSRKTVHRRNISDWIMAVLQRIYSPILHAVLKAKKITIAVALILFALSAWTFSRMGGEFIPTLEEGDLTVEISMMQGASLSESIKTFSKAEQILKAKFPEIRQVVTRIGSAEIPTDPMPFERGDMMLSMNTNKKQWTSAKTRPEMMEKIKDALSVIPGISVEITQPMQMRFNELMTGIRQDVAIKIYGDDLDMLAAEANKTANLIAGIRGVSAPYVEKVTGLPEFTVAYNRDKLAQYGLSISDVNMILKTAFAGNVAGVVFEGEKRFDLVVRLQRDERNDISNLRNLYIPLPSGNQIPLSQVADIEFKEAPAQISREEGKRRIYVGFNVRGRDVQSVVEDIKKMLDKKLQLPPGYYITYGGQFQNLVEAKQRLSVALPIAIALIMILLFFAFHSVKQTLLIFTAVPLSAIGGVFALWIRGMPFSISAGIGFIALFGVAVLNGMVLISYFNQLKEEGVADIYERVKMGTKARLRPVIMTASVASLGFFPMAFSVSAGAEVQKPLATVVIGGLISATLLTLLVLPVLYIIFSGKIKNKPMLKASVKPLIMIFLAGSLALFAPDRLSAQSVPKTLEQCINIALQNNLQLKASGYEVEQGKALEKTAWDLNKTELTIAQSPGNEASPDNSIGIMQSLSFPTVYTAQSRLLRQQTILSDKSLQLTKNELIREVKSAWYNLLAGMERLKLVTYQDSIYRHFSERADLRYKTGETSNVERLSARSRYQEVQIQERQARSDVEIYQLELQKLLNTTEPVMPADSSLSEITGVFTRDTASVSQNPLLSYYAQQVNVADARTRLEKNKLLPDLSLGYYQQYLVPSFNPAKIDRSYTPNTRIAGVQVGLGIPLFFGAQAARIKASKIQERISDTELHLAGNNLRTSYSQAYQRYIKLQQSLNYYESAGLRQANELLKVSQLSYDKGEIGYVEYIQNLTQSVDTKLLYIETLSEYNQAVIQLSYLQGNK